jgi:hypothetical protein
VKSSAMMARQPSVPNRMSLTISQYKRRKFLREAALGNKVVYTRRQNGAS